MEFPQARKGWIPPPIYPRSPKRSWRADTARRICIRFSAATSCASLPRSRRSPSSFNPRPTAHRGEAACRQKVAPLASDASFRLVCSLELLMKSLRRFTVLLLFPAVLGIAQQVHPQPDSSRRATGFAYQSGAAHGRAHRSHGHTGHQHGTHYLQAL